MLLRRLVQLYVGLVLFGLTCGMLILSDLGNMPWDVLGQGFEVQTGLGTGVWAIVIGAVVLLLWIPLRVRPGLGTISNVIIVGLVIQLMLDNFAEADDLPVQLALVVGGILVNGLASGLYIGARFGPGPRDGLMTGLAARGHSIRVVRTGIEAIVLIVGIVLGGTFGIATVLYAVAIGPIVHRSLPWLTAPEAEPAGEARVGVAA